MTYAHVLKLPFLSRQVRVGLQNLSTRTIGANNIVQGALPTILGATPPEFFTNTLKLVQVN